MPKWAEVPLGTIITGVVEVYGAVLGTLNFRRAGPKLRCEIRDGNDADTSRWRQDVYTNRGHQLRRSANHTYQYRRVLFRETVFMGSSAEPCHNSGSIEQPEPRETSAI